MAETLHAELPQSDEAERSVLGAILVDNVHLDEVVLVLRPSDFYRAKHQKIFAAMMELADESTPIDLLTLSDRLQSTGALEAVEGVPYLSQLMDGIPRLMNVAHYARIVRDRSVRRQLVRTAGELEMDARVGDADIEELLGQAERKIFAIAEQRMSPGFRGMKELLEESFDAIQKRQDAGHALTGVPTGFTQFDDLTSGLQKGDLIILAARPAMGKTSWALSAAQNAAIRHGKKVAVFSLEMSAMQLAMRLLFSEARVDAQLMRRGQLADRHWAKLVQAFSRLSEARIFMDDTTGIPITEMRAKVRRLKAEHDVDLIILDYLQLASLGGRHESRQQEISAISRSLKEMARELNVPVLALSQLSRAPDQRTGDHRPHLSDLRESGCLAGDTKVVLADSGRRVPIRDLVGRSGFSVLALDEETCRIGPARVSRAFATGIKPTFEIRTRLGRTIRATANHQFRTFDGWTRLDALKPKDRIALPRVLTPASCPTMSEHELALLGHLVGDGCTLPRHVIQYTTRERDLADHVAFLATRLFGNEVRPRIVEERSWLEVYLTSTRHHARGTRSAVAEWLEGLGAFGLRAHEKHVPELVFQQPTSHVATFLRHLWATDGHVGMRAVTGRRRIPNIFYATSSAALAADVQSLLLRLGINARRSRVPQPGKGRDQWHVSLSGRSDVARFLDVVGTVPGRRTEAADAIRTYLDGVVENTNRDVVPAKAWHLHALPAREAIAMTHRELSATIETAYCGSSLYRQNMSRERALRVALAVSSERLERIATSDVYWDEIAAIEACGEEEVFDLTVPGHHNFIADDIVVHNSLEQDADVVAFIFREEIYRIREGKDAGDKKGVAEIIIAKQRNGPTDTVKLAFIKEWTRFENLQPEDEGRAPLPPPPREAMEEAEAPEAEDRAPF